MNINRLYGLILIWRTKYISTGNFVLLLSIIIGIAGGLAAAILKFLVHSIQLLLFELREIIIVEYLYLIFPLIGLILTVAYIIYLNRNKLGHGIPNILYSINKKAGIIEEDKMYSHMASSSLTVGFGGSVGLEAPIVTTGSAIGSNIGRLFHLDYKNRLLMIGCGAAAATSAIFGAPIAGIIFVLEILLLELSVPSFIPLLLASVTGMIVANVLGSTEVLIAYDLDYVLQMREVPLYVLLGIFTGIISIFFTRTVYFIEAKFQKIKARFSKAVIAGVLVGILVFIFPPLYGEGFDTIRQILTDQPSLVMEGSVAEGLIGKVWVLPVFVLGLIIFKAIATPLTIAGGGNGGIFGPCIFLGAATGFLFARLFNIAPFDFDLVESSFALVAMAGLMSGVMHAPLTGIFLIAEITTGYNLIIPLMIVSAISFVTAMFFRPVFNIADAAISVGVIMILVFQKRYFKETTEEDLSDEKKTTETGELSGADFDPNITEQNRNINS